MKALDRVDLSVSKREVLALAGESGSGKSVTALTILRLLPQNAQITSGRILFKGIDLLTLSAESIRKIRATEIAAVFQDPATFLNPVLTLGEQLREAFFASQEALRYETPVTQHGGSLDEKTRAFLLQDRSLSHSEPDANQTSGDIKSLVIELSTGLLKLVGLPDPEAILKQYPHELSGGMRQRCTIAMALARRPSLLLADEITTALDVTVQAQVLELLKRLRDTINASTLFITHDLAVAAEIADRVAIMYAGNIVEVASTLELFKNPLHPYTQLLLKSIPDIRQSVPKLEPIPGSIPDLVNPPRGCRFHPRCPYAMEKCRTVTPTLKDIGGGHLVHCHLY